MSREPNRPERDTLGFFQTMRTVLWGFFGVRKSAGYQQDAARINPLHLVIAGVLCGIIFVVTLIAIVRWAIASLT